MSTQTKGSNGTATPKPEGKDNAKPVVATVVNLNPKQEEKPLGPKSDVPSLEDRLYRLSQLFELQKKYDRLKISLQKLNDFEIKKDGERSHISIQDDSRNSFETYNPEIISEVIEFIKVKTAEKIKSIEPKLVW